MQGNFKLWQMPGFLSFERRNMGRDITKCHPSLQAAFKELATRCNAQGLTIGLGECFRTVAEQDALYAQGRTEPGSIISNAKGSSYSSQHQWGIAFDFYRNDGKGAYNDSDHFFQQVGEVGKSLELGWGGDWTSIVDKPHIYLPNWGSGTGRGYSLLPGRPQRPGRRGCRFQISQGRTSDAN